MNEIYGWLGTYKNGQINIQHKSVKDILIEDLGYADVIIQEYTLRENDSDEDMEQDYNNGSMMSMYRRLDNDELFELSNFLTSTSEIYRGSERMVFKIDETAQDIYDQVMYYTANIMVMEV